jgi:hypothetical protein
MNGLSVVGLGPVASRARFFVDEVLDRGAQAAARGSVVVRRRYLIVVPRPMSAAPRRHLIVVRMPLPAAPLAERRRYLVVVLDQKFE